MRLMIALVLALSLITFPSCSSYYDGYRGYGYGYGGYRDNGWKGPAVVAGALLGLYGLHKLTNKAVVVKETPQGRELVSFTKYRDNRIFEPQEGYRSKEGLDLNTTLRNKVKKTKQAVEAQEERNRLLEEQEALDAMLQALRQEQGPPPTASSSSNKPRTIRPPKDVFDLDDPNLKDLEPPVPGLKLVGYKPGLHGGMVPVWSKY